MHRFPIPPRFPWLAAVRAGLRVSPACALLGLLAGCGSPERAEQAPEPGDTPAPGDDGSLSDPLAPFGAPGDDPLPDPLEPDSQGGQLGEETQLADCDLQQTAEVGFDDAEPLGFSAREVLRAVLGQTPGAFVWSDSRADFGGSGAAAARLTVARGEGSPLFRLGFRRDEEAAGELLVECGRQLFIPVSLRLDIEASGGGGAVSETLEMTLLASSASEASGTAAALRRFGGFDVRTLHPDATLTANLHLWSSTLHLQVEGVVPQPEPERPASPGDPLQPEAVGLQVGEFSASLSP